MPSTKAEDKTAVFDRHDLTGKWNRVSPFQTYSNVPGGANELQASLLGQAPAPQKLDVETAEAPFTPEGKAKFDKTTVPAFHAYKDGMGHIGTYWDPNGGELGKIASALLKWQFKGDKEAAKMFQGPECGLCQDPKWHVSKKNME
jgi:hypothetical protein